MLTPDASNISSRPRFRPTDAASIVTHRVQRSPTAPYSNSAIAKIGPQRSFSHDEGEKAKYVGFDRSLTSSDAGVRICTKKYVFEPLFEPQTWL